jgi:hypothetical protein
MESKKEPDYKALCKELFLALKELRDVIDLNHKSHHIGISHMVKADSVIQKYKDTIEKECNLYKMVYTVELIVYAEDEEEALKIGNENASKENHILRSFCKVSHESELDSFSNSLPWSNFEANEDELTCSQILNLTRN